MIIINIHQYVFSIPCRLYKDQGIFLDRKQTPQIEQNPTYWLQHMGGRFNFRSPSVCSWSNILYSYHGTHVSYDIAAYHEWKLRTTKMLTIRKGQTR